MKFLEKILAILILVFFVLNLILVPFSGVLLTISLLTISLIYYPFGFAFFNNIRLRNIFKKVSYKSVTVLHIIGAIVIGMALSDICVGILFKIQGYPMANYLLIVGLISTAIILIIGLIRYLKSKSSYYSFMFKRIAIIGFIGLFFLIISDLTLVKIRFRNHPDYVKAYQEYKANPKTSESEKKLKLEYMRATLSEDGFQIYQESMKTDTTD
jgi:hypothetical protein